MSPLAQFRCTQTIGVCTRLTALIVLGFISLAMAPVGSATGQETGPAQVASAFPDLSIPANATLPQLEALVAKAELARPATGDQFKSKQTAIRDASRQIRERLKDKADSPAYQKAELDQISASVALMTFAASEDDKAKTLEQLHDFLKGRETLNIPDIQTGMLAATMLELQPNKMPARKIYQLLDELLTDDERPEMQSLRVNLKANIRRLDLLGESFELQASTVDGNAINTAELKGKYLIVSFFVTWSKPCLEELPRLKAQYEKYHARGLEVIGVSLDHDPQALAKFLDNAVLPWPVIHDNAEDPLDSIRLKFGISALPTVLLINKEGTVVSLEALGSELERLMQLLFETPTPAPAQQPAK